MIYKKLGDNSGTVYHDGRPTREDKVKYYNTSQLTMMLSEMEQILGTDAVLDFLKEKTKYYKDMKKEGK